MPEKQMMLAEQFEWGTNIFSLPMINTQTHYKKKMDGRQGQREAAKSLTPPVHTHIYILDST